MKHPNNTVPVDAHVMIVGAMKAGTSYLFSLLRQHPAICSARVKEPEFFSEHQGHGVRATRYEDFFDFDGGKHMVCLEASTGYAKYPQEIGIPKRMKAYGLQPRFIYIVREPVDRISSHLNYARMNNHAWALESLAGFHAVALSMYYTQMREYLACFPDLGRYFIADFDELKNDPCNLARRIFEWLDLEALTVETDGPVNPTPQRSRTELALTRSPLHKLRHLLPSPLRAWLKSVLRSRGAPAQQDLTELDRRRLREWLAPDISAFGETFTFPVEKWGFEIEEDVSVSKDSRAILTAIGTP